MCGGRLEKRSQVLKNALLSWNPTSPSLSSALQTIIWLVSSSSRFRLTFQAKGKRRQTQPSPCPGQVRSSCLRPRRMSTSYVTDNDRFPCPGPNRPTPGSAGGAFTRTMPLWPINLSLACSQTIIWSSSNPSSKRDFGLEKKWPELSRREGGRGKAAFIWSVQTRWSNDPGNMLAKTLETLW